MRKFLFPVLSSVAVSSSVLAATVHDAGFDLLEMARSTSAPEIENVYGGVWTYISTTNYFEKGVESPYRRVNLNGYNSSFSDGAFLARFDSNVTLALNQYGSAKGDETLFGAGVTAASHELIMIPSAEWGPDIRFKFPRAGRYSVKAVFRSLNRGSGKVLLTVAKNRGASVLWQEYLERDGASEVTKTYETTAETFAAGDYLEFIVQSTSDGPENDVTGLLLTVTEEDRTYFDAGDAVVASALAQESYYTADRINTGTWVPFRAEPESDDPAATGLPYKASTSRRLLGTEFIWPGNLSPRWGVGWESGESSIPIWGVITNGSFYTEAGKGYGPGNNDFLPGECYVHPFDSRQVAGLLFRPSLTGLYEIRIQARLMSAGNQDGVTLYVLVDGERKLRQELVGETGTLRMKIEDLPLFRASEVRFVVHGRTESLATDTTFLRIKIARLSDKTYSLNDAFFDHIKAGGAYPKECTDANGVRWEYGYRLTQDGAFAQYDYTGSYASGYPAGLMKWKGQKIWGFMRNPNTSGSFLASAVNQSGEIIDFGWGSRDADFYAPKEVMLHLPGQDLGVQAVVRGHAPKKGLYAVSGCFHYAQDGTNADGNRAAIRIADAGTPACAWISKPSADSNTVGRLLVEEIWLDKDEAVDWQVGGLVSAVACATALEGYFRPTGDAPDDVGVNVNFCEAGAADVSLRGRIGWANERWNNVPATSAQSRQLVNTAGVETGFFVELAHTNGMPLTGGTNADAPNALMQGGVVSANSADALRLTLCGLKPGAEYAVCLYARGANSIKGWFMVDGSASPTTSAWFMDGGDHVKTTVVAASDGRAQVSFVSADESAPCLLSGLQIRGEAFGKVRRGFMVFIR